jgi:hypothetical protein
MRVTVIHCPLCEWKHEEVDALSAMPAGMLRAFSEPLALSNIMRRRESERIELALSEHLGTHTTLEWLRALQAARSELDRLKATFPG